jgi:hypothetical protein
MGDLLYVIINLQINQMCIKSSCLQEMGKGDEYMLQDWLRRSFLETSANQIKSNQIK